MPKKITTIIFIERSNKIHKNKYDYSLVNYINNTIKVDIICSIHGKFSQSPKNHMNGSGCVKCLGKYKLTTERFKMVSNDIHNNKYDYSLVEYKNMRTKVKIICPIHGKFEQTPDNHLKKCGCPSCGDVKVPTTEDFIINANIKHNNKYDYSLVDYIGSHTKIKIICPIHGEFDQTPTNHISGQGCPKCDGKQLTQSEILDKFKKRHGNLYDYSLVKYINNKNEITIICSVHGIFYQTPQNHLGGSGCHICGGSNKKTLDEFISHASKIHNNKYEYSLVEYKNAKTKIQIVCPIHGIFTQKTSHHLSGVGCPYCKESQGEKSINKYLIENNIKFERQYKFKDCKYKYCLPFDFYLPKYNLCVEFDGIQHFESIKYWGGDVALSKQIIKDEIKNEYCKNNNIDLIRIRYDENIIDKLNLTLK